MEWAVTDLPEPLSPTRARVSPLRMSKLTPSTTRCAWSPVTNSTARSRISIRFSLISLPRVEGIAGGFADEHQQAQHDGQHAEGGNAQPGRLQVGLGLGHQLTQRRRAGGQTETEEVQGGQGADGAGQYERHEG